MAVKEIIVILLLSGSLQILASDNFDKSSEVNHEYQSEQIKHFKNKENKFRDPSLQFQKDYYKWENKKHGKSKKYRDSSDYMNLNEIESQEYVDKYNKYGNTFNPKVLSVEKSRTAYQQKRASESEGQPEAHEKPKDLSHDIDVNFVGGSMPQTKDLSHDMDVNFVGGNKKVAEDSELLSENDFPRRSKEKYEENYQNGNELYMKREKKNFYQNLNKIDLSNPPSPNDTVLMARYIVHTVDWASVATLSSRPSTKGSPFVCVKATSDGMQNASSGIPFFYLTPRDLCTQDLQKDNRVSILVTLSETDYCKENKFDPQDPRCAKLVLSGKIKTIKSGSDEEKFAKTALFSRHPDMESWPACHDWYFAKLKIGQIILIDKFGGASYIKVKDYLNGKEGKPELRK